MKKILYIAGAAYIMASMALTSCNYCNRAKDDKEDTKSKNQPTTEAPAPKVIDQFSDGALFKSDTIQGGSLAVLSIEGDEVNLVILPKEGDDILELGKLKYEKTENGITFNKPDEFMGLIQEDNILTITDANSKVTQYPNLVKVVDANEAPATPVKKG